MKTFLRVASAAFAAAIFAVAPATHAQTISPNSGSLGTAGDGTTTSNAILEVPGPLATPADYAIYYTGGARTTIPYHAALNPPSGSPFSVEFWANPTASDNDDAPLANRIATGNRSGWAFFQRDTATGWNFRMYNGNGSALGWDLTGGTATHNAWSHVVATWDGSAARLYVNGQLADDINAGGLTNTYNASTSAIFSIGSLFDGGSASNASVDEVAFYGTALGPGQVFDHYLLAFDPTPGAYSSTVLADGAIVYLQNVPEPSSVVLLAIGAVGCGLWIRRRATC